MLTNHGGVQGAEGGRALRGSGALGSGAKRRRLQGQCAAQQEDKGFEMGRGSMQSDINCGTGVPPVITAGMAVPRRDAPSFKLLCIADILSL